MYGISSKAPQVAQAAAQVAPKAVKVATKPAAKPAFATPKPAQQQHPVGKKLDKHA